jgi:hypothetical protein
MIPRIATVGTSFRPLPCQAWYGYGVTGAYRVEVDVGADGHASAPPSGAAAAAPPAGAVYDDKYYICMTNRTPWSRKKRVSPTRGKISILSNLGACT